MTPRLRLVAVALVCLSGVGADGRVTARVRATGQAASTVSTPPHRVFASATRQPSTFEALVDDLVTADVVFVGERHDSAPTHLIELALLQQVGRRRDGVVLALEMFERDVQEPLDHFLMGHMSEAEFLKAARPWPRYATDYKPLVDLAIAREWPVVAANVPRQLAAEVARAGAGALDTRPTPERAWFAATRDCPTSGAYFTRFRTAVTEHQPGAAAGASGGTSTSVLVPATTPAAPPASGLAQARPSLDAAAIERYYLAQCLKDETMAESIAQAHAAASIGGRKALVVSVNGGFHSEFGQGVVAATGRRMAGKRLATIAIVPVADLSRVAPDAADWPRADYLIYTDR